MIELFLLLKIITELEYSFSGHYPQGNECIYKVYIHIPKILAIIRVKVEIKIYNTTWGGFLSS